MRSTADEGAKNDMTTTVEVLIVTMCSADRRESISGVNLDEEAILLLKYQRAYQGAARFVGVVNELLDELVQGFIVGFDLLPVMEDITFGKKLRKAGRISVLPDIIYVSSRKWHEKGFIRTFLDYTCAYLRLWTGQLK